MVNLSLEGIGGYGDTILVKWRLDLRMGGKWVGVFYGEGDKGRGLGKGGRERRVVGNGEGVLYGTYFKV